MCREKLYLFVLVITEAEVYRRYLTRVSSFSFTASAIQVAVGI